MRIRSNGITAHDVRCAVGVVPSVLIIDGVREWEPRKSSGFENGCEFYLAGVGSRHVRRSKHDGDYFAATWSDWGIIINHLYRIDPDAEIGCYKNYDHFMRETERQAPIRKEETPWLKVTQS